MTVYMFMEITCKFGKSCTNRICQFRHFCPQGLHCPDSLTGYCKKIHFPFSKLDVDRTTCNFCLSCDGISTGLCLAHHPLEKMIIDHLQYTSPLTSSQIEHVCEILRNIAAIEREAYLENSQKFGISYDMLVELATKAGNQVNASVAPKYIDFPVSDLVARCAPPSPVKFMEVSWTSDTTRIWSPLNMSPAPGRFA